jgi:hypothetical protein
MNAFLNLNLQVVLPDLKRSENDVVVFLDEQFSTSDLGEVEQYGAVASLHRVAGDRQLHMLLPPQYKQLWLDIASASAQKAAERASRAEASAQRKQKETSRRSNLAHRGPKVSRARLFSQYESMKHIVNIELL